MFRHDKQNSACFSFVGYYSDEDEDDVKYSRRMKGKKYASLPKDDSFDQPSRRQPTNGGVGPNHQKIDNVKTGQSSAGSYSFRVERRHTSGSVCSDSEEYDSEVEAPSNTTYLTKKGGTMFNVDISLDHPLSLILHTTSANWVSLINIVKSELQIQMKLARLIG